MSRAESAVRIRFLALSLIALLVLRQSASADPCVEPNTIGSTDPNATVDYPSTIPSAEVSLYNGIIRAGFDLPEGSLYGSAESVGTPFNFIVQVSDTYRIDGAPAGQPTPIVITLSAEIRSDRNADHSSPDCYACSHRTPQFLLRVSSLGATDSLWSCVCGVDTTYASIAIAPGPGEEFEVHYKLFGMNGISGGAAIANASIRFTGVPPGATVISTCRADEPAVPVRLESWGRLRARYR